MEIVNIRSQIISCQKKKKKKVSAIQLCAQGLGMCDSTPLLHSSFQQKPKHCPS